MINDKFLTEIDLLLKTEKHIVLVATQDTSATWLKFTELITNFIQTTVISGFDHNPTLLSEASKASARTLAVISRSAAVALTRLTNEFNSGNHERIIKISHLLAALGGKGVTIYQCTAVKTMFSLSCLEQIGGHIYADTAKERSYSLIARHAFRQDLTSFASLHSIHPDWIALSLFILFFEDRTGIKLSLKDDDLVSDIAMVVSLVSEGPSDAYAYSTSRIQRLLFQSLMNPECFMMAKIRADIPDLRKETNLATLTMNIDGLAIPDPQLTIDSMIGLASYLPLGKILSPLTKVVDKVSYVMDLVDTVGISMPANITKGFDKLKELKGKASKGTATKKDVLAFAIKLMLQIGVGVGDETLIVNLDLARKKNASEALNDIGNAMCWAIVSATVSQRMDTLSLSDELVINQYLLNQDFGLFSQYFYDAVVLRTMDDRHAFNVKTRKLNWRLFSPAAIYTLDWAGTSLTDLADQPLDIIASWASRKLRFSLDPNDKAYYKKALNRDKYVHTDANYTGDNINTSSLIFSKAYPVQKFRASAMLDVASAAGVSRIGNADSMYFFSTLEYYELTYRRTTRLLAFSDVKAVQGETPLLGRVLIPSQKEKTYRTYWPVIPSDWPAVPVITFVMTPNGLPLPKENLVPDQLPILPIPFSDDPTNFIEDGVECSFTIFDNDEEDDAPQWFYLIQSLKSYNRKGGDLVTLTDGLNKPKNIS